MQQVQKGKSVERGGAQVAVSASTTVERGNQRVASIATAAYYRSEARGFEPGHELDDWLEAEREVDATRPRPN